jgi:transposase
MGKTAELTTESSLELVRQLQQKNDQLEDHNKELEHRNKELEQTLQELQSDLKALKKLLYAKLRPGVSRLDELSSGQQFLFGSASELPRGADSEETPVESPPRKPRSKSTGRQPLPPGLLRVPEIESVDKADLLCSCCSPPQERKLIRYEETEILEYKPAELFVRVIQREVRACPTGMEGVTTAPLAPRIIDKGRPGVSLLVFVVISKYVDHLPLHRIAKIFIREQIRIPESTLCDWVAAVADALAPIVVAMKQWLLSQPYLQADETPAKARDPGTKGKLKQIYFFACSLPWKEVVFEYCTDRTGESLSRFLSGFAGEVLQVDEYTGYSPFFRENESVTRAGCWAHGIRKFKIALAAADRVVPAHRVCHLVRRMEQLETLMRTLGRTSERLVIRQRTHSRAVAQIRQVVDDGLADPTIEPQSDYGKAIRYLHNHWEALTAFLDDDRVEMDNNGIENAIRPLAIGRKNWLHIGHIDAGDRAAVFYSLLATCNRLGIDPREYLSDVLERIPSLPIDRIPELIPRNWQAARIAESDSPA